MTERIRRNYQILRDGFRQTDPQTLRRHLILFALTFFTVFMAGTNFSSRTSPGDRYKDAAVYAIAVMLILSGYSLARYIQARAYGLFATLPFFIPMPLFSPFGTFGVVTRTANTGVNNRALFDVAFWGPAMSFLLSVPCLIVGTWLSEVVAGTPQFENPLVLKLIAKAFKDIPYGYDLAVHPLLAAGWAGIFFTAINLLPLGNLSGGQIAFALFGRRQRDIAYVFMTGLFILALWYPMWFGFVLGFIYLGVEHPESRNASNPLFYDMSQATTRQPLDRRRQYMAVAAALIFLVSFTTRPFDATGEKAGERPPIQIDPPEHYGNPPGPSQPQAAPTDENSI